VKIVSAFGLDNRLACKFGVETNRAFVPDLHVVFAPFVLLLHVLKFVVFVGLDSTFDGKIVIGFDDPYSF
jgi:hypothetical protein